MALKPSSSRCRIIPSVLEYSQYSRGCAESEPAVAGRAEWASTTIAALLRDIEVEVSMRCLPARQAWRSCDRGAPQVSALQSLRHDTIAAPADLAHLVQHQVQWLPSLQWCRRCSVA